MLRVRTGRTSAARAACKGCRIPPPAQPGSPCTHAQRRLRQCPSPGGGSALERAVRAAGAAGVGVAGSQGVAESGQGAEPRCACDRAPRPRSPPGWPPAPRWRARRPPEVMLRLEGSEFTRAGTRVQGENCQRHNDMKAGVPSLWLLPQQRRPGTRRATRTTHLHHPQAWPGWLPPAPPRLRHCRPPRSTCLRLPQELAASIQRQRPGPPYGDTDTRGGESVLAGGGGDAMRERASLAAEHTPPFPPQTRSPTCEALRSAPLPHACSQPGHGACTSVSGRPVAAVPPGVGPREWACPAVRPHACRLAPASQLPLH